MRKIIFGLISLIVVTSVFFSCDETPTAQELLEGERKAIKRFLDDKKIIVTTDTAEMYNDKTGKVYYRTNEGLYIHVIDKGNGIKAEPGTKITVRYKDLSAIANKAQVDTLQTGLNLPNGNMNALNPDIFYHEMPSTFSSGLACEGLDIGLTFVKQNGEVSLIIPTSLLPRSFQINYEPLYFGYLIYRFDGF